MVQKVVFLSGQNHLSGSFFALKRASVLVILSAFVTAFAAAHLTAVLVLLRTASLLLVLISFLHD